MLDRPPVDDPDELTAWLSHHYLGRLRLFAVRRLNDADLAEDVVQESLTTILKALRAGRIRAQAAIAAFAFETVRNICMHRTRSQARYARAVSRLEHSPAVQTPDVLTQLISEERARLVREALSQLDADERRLLIMTFVDGRTSAQIGTDLGLAPGAVRVRRHRAIRRLGDALGVTVDGEWEQE